MITPGKRYAGSTQAVTASFYLTDVLTDPDTVKARVLSPSCSETSYTYGTDDEVSKSSTGVYQLIFTPDAGGRWHIRWEATYTGSGVAVSEEAMLVQLSPFEDGTLDAYRS